MGIPTLSSIIRFPFQLAAFLWSLHPFDVWVIVTTALQKTLSPNALLDDRRNAVDKNLQVIAKAPQNNVITKYLIGAFLRTLWDRTNKPFVVVPPKGTLISSIPINNRFRTPDGSGNSARYPTVGMGNTNYSTVKASKRSNPLPDAEKIFDQLMKRSASQFVPHPNNINVFMFDLAIVITHDLFWTLDSDPSINIASSYVDLQALYGRSEAEERKVRTFKDGKIHPDFFADTRIAFQLPAVGALLVLFSRNHNYIAEKLKQINEDNKFCSTKYLPDYLDEKLFQTARLINGGCFVNLVISDYLRTILGLAPDSTFLLNPAAIPPPFDPTYGNQVSLSFNYVYRWHSVIGQEDEKILLELFTNMQKSKDKLNIEDGLPLPGLNRGRDGKFADKELAIEIRKAMGQVAGHPGAFNIPDALKPFEVFGINQGREGGLLQPTLNEFREHLGLKKYKKFEDFNTDRRVTEALKALYTTPDDVELYPGLIAEQTQDKKGGVGINEGIGLGYTTSYAILVDAVNLIRNDRFLTTDFNAHNLTEWGHSFCSDPSNVGLNAYKGSVMAHLLSLLNGEFHPNEPCVKSPFRMLSTTDKK